MIETVTSQVGGTHYEDMEIQPWEVIARADLDFWEGNVVKYVMRYKTKNGLEDLMKARHYLEYLIHREAEKGEPIPASKRSDGLASSGDYRNFYSSIGAVPAVAGIPDSKER